MEVSRASFGALPDGRRVEIVTLANGRGVTARVISLGAALQSWVLPDRDGQGVDVIAGYDDLAGFVRNPNYFGATIGRYANRIGGGRFALEGQEFRLDCNEGTTTLHGGSNGLDRQLWQVASAVQDEVARVVLSCTSEDGDQGFPGTLCVTATYALDESGKLSLEYRATTDRPTIVNLTGHAYFNLAGGGRDVAGHVLTIPAETFTPTDAALIPTGVLRAVAATPFDFREPTPIGARWRDGDAQIVLGRGYDHNWAIARAPSDEPMLHARLIEPASGRGLEVWSNMPGLQVYSGNCLDGSIVGKGGRTYRQGDALCLEPQLFPDTPNKPEFGSARLDPGETYLHRIEYRPIVTR